jgi:3',5'-cyclic AMP phosphodiesterase CpdA
MANVSITDSPGVPPPSGADKRPNGRETVRIAHLSDLHLGAEDPAAVEALASELSVVKPSLTVVTGDLTMRARAGQFRRARALLNLLPRPLLVVTGNHDLPLLRPTRLTDPYGGYRRWITADLNPVVRADGITALGMQSTTPWRFTNGRVSAGQAHQVTRTLGAAPDGNIRLLAMHHPPAHLLGGSRLGGLPVDLLLAGHTHIPSVQPLPHGVLVVAGTAVSRRVRQGTPQSWSELTIDGGELVVRERYFGSKGWFTGRTVTCSFAS